MNEMTIILYMQFSIYYWVEIYGVAVRAYIGYG